jgi:hypothetical protein
LWLTHNSRASAFESLARTLQAGGR